VLYIVSQRPLIVGGRKLAGMWCTESGTNVLPPFGSNCSGKIRKGPKNQDLASP
jgi:hypothetical protein